jgi:hypothetical protein
MGVWGDEVRPSEDKGDKGEYSLLNYCKDAIRKRLYF